MTAAAAYIVQLVVAEFAHIRGLVFLKLIEVGICFLIGNIPVLLNGHFFLSSSTVLALLPFMIISLMSILHPLLN